MTETQGDMEDERDALQNNGEEVNEDVYGNTQDPKDNKL